jgi:hypothetical protein
MLLVRYSHLIDDILAADEGGALRATMLCDHYDVLGSANERDEFVAALVHRLLVEHARASHGEARSNNSPLLAVDDLRESLPHSEARHEGEP